jgi:hypothetical protein
MNPPGRSGPPGIPKSTLNPSERTIPKEAESNSPEERAPAIHEESDDRLKESVERSGGGEARFPVFDG